MTYKAYMAVGNKSLINKKQLKMWKSTQLIKHQLMSQRKKTWTVLIKSLMLHANKTFPLKLIWLNQKKYSNIIRPEVIKSLKLVANCHKFKKINLKYSECNKDKIEWRHKKLVLQKKDQIHKKIKNN